MFNSNCVFTRSKHNSIFFLLFITAMFLVFIEPVHAQIGQVKILASDGAEGDDYGWSVSISGDYAIVGAYMDDDSGSASGSAYIYNRSGTTWSEQAKLTASDGAVDDHFGWSVAISGDYAVVGAYKNSDNGALSGSAYVYLRNGSTWSQQAKLLPSDGSVDDHFGWSVAISGDYAVIGAISASSGLGSVYVFLSNGTSWSEQAILLASDGADGALFDRFGESVAISGDYVVVGASSDDDNGTSSGSAYVYMRSNTTWSEQAKLLPSVGAAFDFYGSAVSISGDYIVVGNPQNDDNGDKAGSAYVYMRSGTTWPQQAKILAADGAASDFFGIAVSISGDFVSVGSYLDDDVGGSSGSIYIFKRDDTNWPQSEKVVAFDGFSSDQFGRSIAIDSKYIVVGAWADDDNGTDAGSAYLYTGFIPPGFIVTSNGDGGDSNPGDGVCEDGSGDCTLRAAIEEANALAGKDTISFVIPGVGPHTIQPSTALPAITDSVVIDGYTQPGASPNTNPIDQGSNAVLMIEIDGTNAGVEGAFGILAGGSTIRGLVINRFNGAAIEIVLLGGNLVEGNFIGTDVTGTTALGENMTGVNILESDNTIGGTTEAARNVISGNLTGIQIGGIATGNFVQGNYIGTNAAGTGALGNVYGIIIETNADGNILGGTAEGAGNVISGNTFDGITIQAMGATGNIVQGNFIGTDVSGTAALGNGNNGILIANSSDNTIGGSVDQANIIAFNTWNGVQVESGTGNEIISNSIFGNTLLGIDLGNNGSTPNDPGDADEGANNMQNFPVIINASVDQSEDWLIEYYVDSDPTNSIYPLLIQFFIADPSGEGKTFLMEDTFTTVDHGNESKTVNLGQEFVVENSQNVSIAMTATDDDGNTSEFTSNDFIIGINDEDEVLPEKFSLYNAYPNPFNPSTTLGYAIPVSSNVNLIIYNLLGQEVIRWDESNVSPGYYEKMWNGTTQAGVPVSSGMYIYRLIAGDFTQTKKMVLLK